MDGKIENIMCSMFIVLMFHEKLGELNHGIAVPKTASGL